ncbi:hypothetical protein [Actinomadura sp. 3N508]|uniref:hypothetical protein n=1 Tax=Actinomadura sp. 3N508 TaxID=3375153 RepID=UPI0037AD09E0
MKLVLRLLGREVLAVELDTEPDAPDAGLAPPFGFSGSGGGHVERADTWPIEAPAPGGRAVRR